MSGRSTDISSGHGGVLVTPNDSTVIPTTRALWIGVTGNVAVRMANGDLITWPNVPVGDFVRQVDKVLSTGTTATNIAAVY